MAEATHLERTPDRHRATSKSCLATAASTSSAGQVFVRRVLRDEGMGRSWGGHGDLALTWFWPLKIRIYLIYWYLLIFIDIYWYLLEIFDGQNLVKPCCFTAGHVQSVSSHGEFPSFSSGHVHHTTCNSPGCLRVARSKGEVFSKGDLASTMDHSNPPNM